MLLPRCQCPRLPCTTQHVLTPLHHLTVPSRPSPPGDVAFTNHATPLEVLADGEAPEPWAGTNTAADFRLVCPTGGCRPLADFASCNIAQSPSYAVMTTSTIAGQPLRQQIQVGPVCSRVPFAGFHTAPCRGSFLHPLCVLQPRLVSLNAGRAAGGRQRHHLPQRCAQPGRPARLCLLARH